MSLPKVITFNPINEHGINQDTRLAIYDDMKKDFFQIVVIKARGSYNLTVSDLEEHYQYRFKYQIKVNGKWTDHINYKPIKVELITEDGIKYQYYRKESKYLIVGFQGISRTPTYNYVRTLKSANAARLYIKDDYGLDEDTHSSYYLGTNKSLQIADKVLDLIEKTRNSANISKKNVICIGSSKGGFAALYFAFRGKYGHAITGGPQVLLGNYLSKGKLDGHKPGSILPPILNSLGGQISEDTIEWANNILFNVMLESQHDPHIEYHVGKNEPHYFDHAIPFQKFAQDLKMKNLNFDLGDYETHSELAKYFPSFLTEKVNSICV